MLFIFYKPNTVHQDLPVVQIKLHLLIPKTMRLFLSACCLLHHLLGSCGFF